MAIGSSVGEQICVKPAYPPISDSFEDGGYERILSGYMMPTICAIHGRLVVRKEWLFVFVMFEMFVRPSVWQCGDSHRQSAQSLACVQRSLRYGHLSSYLDLGGVSR